MQILWAFRYNPLRRTSGYVMPHKHNLEIYR
jgi:hypothetical protein